jgi:hypothetical protein
MSLMATERAGTPGDRVRRPVRTRSRLLPVAEMAAQLISVHAKRLEFDAFVGALPNGSDSAGLARDDLDDPLRVLLQAYRDEAALSALGRLAVAWDIKRYLTNLRRLQDEEAHTPDIATEQIRAPVIITGLPRSGTTFLHNLLAEDPANQALRCWQAIYPYPDSTRPDGDDRRPRRVDRQLGSFALLAPAFRSLYPLDGRSPQECTEVTAHVFQSLRFDATHHVPSYRRWLDGSGHLPAYRFHKRFLQHLQRQGDRRRWVLKSPDHVFALDALSSVYPDARIVFMHRDPLKVLPSVAQLTEILRTPFTTRIDRRQIGDQIMTDWALGARTMIDADRHGRFAPARIFHLHHGDLVSRPLDAVRRLYAHFGLPPRRGRGRAHGAARRRQPEWRLWAERLQLRPAWHRSGRGAAAVQRLHASLRRPAGDRRGACRGTPGACLGPLPSRFRLEIGMRAAPALAVWFHLERRARGLARSATRLPAGFGLTAERSPAE